ncbi:D-mannose binding lectin [Amycolatopsis xylanica]|uniref:D-mannose binding lectin n=1 Tax=Amycolatopsis xylanica TaxID=589385 RepID=A0A1H2W588_9PSEU|nr:hypothetical protein [Amycolatopsis xylanica]SDW75750.1 D-mannose binding lectin [Amycolatopsis xylanica]
MSGWATGGKRHRGLWCLVISALLAVGLTGTPAAAERSPLATFPPVAQVHPEAGTPAPRLEGADWVLSPGTHFLPGDYVQTGRSRLIFQADGNLVLYDDLGRARWASGTDHRGQEAIFQRDGNLVVYVRRGDPFASRTCCFSNLEFRILGVGFIAIQGAGNGTILWYQPR